MAYLVDGSKDLEAAETVRAWLAEQTIGDVSPINVDLRRDEDRSGDDAWFFDVTLPDPDPTEGTWPTEVLVDIDRITRDQAIQRGVSWPWYVVFRAETDDQQEDEEDQLQIPEQ